MGENHSNFKGQNIIIRNNGQDVKNVKVRILIAKSIVPEFRS